MKKTFKFLYSSVTFYFMGKLTKIQYISYNFLLYLVTRLQVRPIDGFCMSKEMYHMAECLSWVMQVTVNMPIKLK